MKIFMKSYFSIFVVMFLFPGQVYSQNTGEIRTILTNCNVIDCTGNPIMEDMTIVITGNRITEMSNRRYRGSDQANDVRVLDLDGAYVLPGLWNMHSHLSDLHPDVNNILGTEASASGGNPFWKKRNGRSQKRFHFFTNDRRT